MNAAQEKMTSGRKDDGFTLVELLVVVVIIGILIAIAIPLYLHYEQGAYDASAQSDLRTLRLEERGYDVSNPTFGSSQQLDSANQNLVMSASTLGVVVYADADSFCVATINTKGKPDPAGIGAAIRQPYVVYFYDSSTAQTTSSGWGCSQIQPYDVSHIDGYFDSDGFHN